MYYPKISRLDKYLDMKLGLGLGKRWNDDPRGVWGRERPQVRVRVRFQRMSNFRKNVFRRIYSTNYIFDEIHTTHF